MDEFFSSLDRLDEQPTDRAVHFWEWFARVVTNSGDPTWIVECWSARPPTSPRAPGDQAWALVAEGVIATPARRI